MDFTKVYSPLMLSSAVFLLFIMKTATTTLFRGIYPFAEYFAADMGIPVGRFFLVLSFGELLGAVSPLLGPLAERVGPRRMLLINGATNAAFGVLVGLGLSTFGLFVAAWCMYCVAKTMLFSSGGAFIGTFVPKQWRTRATGVAEISWGIASFVGLPFIGFIVSVAPYGWMMYSMSIFMAMGVGLMYVVLRWGSRDPTSGAPDSSLPIVAVTVDASDQPETKGFDRVSPEPNSEFKLIPVTTTVEKRHVATDESKQESSMENGRSRRKLDRIGASARYLRPKRCSPQLGIFKVVLKDKSAWCLLVTCIIAITCTSVMFTNYSFWVVELHDLTPRQLGVASTAVGVAELLGEFVVILVGDRINPALSAVICFVLGIVFSLAIITVKSASLTANMSVLACLMFVLEAEFVFLLAVGTQIVKAAQPTLFLVIFSSLQLARFTAALVVHPLWVKGGIVLTVVVTAGMQAVGLVVCIPLWRRVMAQNRGAELSQDVPPLDNGIELGSPATKEGVVLVEAEATVL